MYQASDEYFKKIVREGINRSSSLAQLTPQAIRQLRRQKRESQDVFWRRFGITQSSGSRFEIGDPLPATLVIMLRLYIDEKLTDELLDGYTPL